MSELFERKTYKVIYTNITNMSSNTLHYPQLNTILMVEEFIKEHSGKFRKKALWQHLPKKMMYQTFNTIFEYLLDSKKIALDREKKVAWIWNPKLVEKYLSSNELRVR